MSDTATKPTLLEDLRSRADALNAELDTLIDEREEGRTTFEALEGPSEDQRTAEQASEDEFRSSSEDKTAELESLNERVEQQTAKVERRKVAEESAIGEVTVKEPLIYREDNAHEFSYMKDLMATDQKVQQAMIGDSRAALERLHKHGRQMEERIPQEEAERKRAGEARVEEAEREFRGSLAHKGVAERELVSPFERRVSPNRAPGQGGEFIPPKWEIDQYAPYLRAGRVVAPLTRNMPLPPGTDVVKIPRVKGPTEVAPQLADNAGIASKDLETESIEAPIKTIAGMQDVALQAIEMSPNQIFGRMVQEDLLADWNRKVDLEVIAGQGTNYTTLNAGTIKGLAPAANWGGEAHESGSAASGQTILQGLGCNRAFIATKRFNTEGVVHVLHPKRGEYLMNTYDITSETGRRLIEPSSFAQFNVSAKSEGVSPAEGHILSLPSGSDVYQSANIPVTFNKAGTAIKSETYDAGLTFKGDDVWFFESDARMGVFSEVLSGTLTVRYRIYSYIGMLVRFEPSVQVCGGTPFVKEPSLGGYKYGA
jgi:hypothetical protein